VRGFAIEIVVSALAFAILAYVMPRFEFNGDTIQLVALAAVFGVVNGLIKPIVKLLSFPINAMTLGLFGLVINGLLLLALAWGANVLFGVPFTVAGFPDSELSLDAIVVAVVAGIVLSILTAIIGLVVPD
jgi:putative membrane protein